MRDSYVPRRIFQKRKSAQKGLVWQRVIAYYTSFWLNEHVHYIPAKGGPLRSIFTTDWQQVCHNKRYHTPVASHATYVDLIALLRRVTTFSQHPQHVGTHSTLAAFSGNKLLLVDLSAPVASPQNSCESIAEELRVEPGGSGSSLIFVRVCAISGFDTPPFNKARQR